MAGWLAGWLVGFGESGPTGLDVRGRNAQGIYLDCGFNKHRHRDGLVFGLGPHSLTMIRSVGRCRVGVVVK